MLSLDDIVNEANQMDISALEGVFQKRRLFDYDPLRDALFLKFKDPIDPLKEARNKIFYADLQNPGFYRSTYTGLDDRRERQKRKAREIETTPISKKLAKKTENVADAINVLIDKYKDTDKYRETRLIKLRDALQLKSNKTLVNRLSRLSPGKLTAGLDKIVSDSDVIKNTRTVLRDNKDPRILYDDLREGIRKLKSAENNAIAAEPDKKASIESKIATEIANLKSGYEKNMGGPDKTYKPKPKKV